MSVAGWIGGMAAALGCVGYGIGRRNRRWCVVGAALLFLCAGGLRCAWMQAHERTLPYYLLDGSGVYTLTVMTDPELFGSGDESVVRYGARLHDVVYDDGAADIVKGNVYWYTGDTAPYRIGDRVTVRGRMAGFRYYHNPGNILLDYRRRAQDYIGNLYEDHDREVVRRGTDTSYRAARYIQSVRSGIDTFLRRHMHPAETAVLANSLLFGGNYRELSPQVTADFATTGIIHILSVSGSHISLLFGVLLGLGAWTGLSRKAVFVGAVAVVGGYAALAGWVPPVVRSFIMGTATIGALVWRQQHLATHWLGLTVIGMLGYQPYLLYDVSFQLSVGATTGILLFAPPLRRQLRRRLPSAVATAAAVTIGAQVLLVPLLLYYFHALPTYAILSNLTVGVLLEIAIILCLAALVLQTVPLVGAYLAWLGSRCIAAAVAVNAHIARWPLANWYGRGWDAAETAAYYVLIAVVVMAFRSAGMRRRIWGAAGMCVALLLLLPSGYAGQADIRVIIPDTGLSRGVIIEHAGTSLVYYREGERASSRVREQAEWISALAYFGIRRPELWIQETSTGTWPSSAGIAPKHVIVRPYESIDESDQAVWRQTTEDGWTIEYQAAGVRVHSPQGRTVVWVPTGETISPTAVDTHTCIVPICRFRNGKDNERIAVKRPAAVIIPPLRYKHERNTEQVWTSREIPSYDTATDGCVVGMYRDGRWSIRAYGE